MRAQRRGRNRTRGVALLIVLVVLVLVATLATEIAISARTHFKLAEHSMNELLLRTAVEGRVNILKSALRYDLAKKDNLDTEDDEWAWKHHDELSKWGEPGQSSFGDLGTAEQAVRFRNRDVNLTAWVEDERAKINLRGLAKPKESEAHKHTREALVRLIDLYREDTDYDLSESDAREMVDDLEEWLEAEAGTDEDPLPKVKANRGRLQCLDDLLRVPGGKWLPERLYDVRDPEAADEEEGGLPTTGGEEGKGRDAAAEDSTWTRRNGLPGLARYLTVWAEDVADPPLRINLNTAPQVVLAALFDAGDEEFAKQIVEERRKGASEEGASAGGTGGTGGTAGTGGTGGQQQGWFKAKTDLSRIEGLDKLDRFPRLNWFADVSSTVFSLRVIAKIVAQPAEGGGGGSDGDEAGEDAAPREILATWHHREVVQRGQNGFVTLFVERRQDPIF